MIPLIDGDLIAFRCAASCEKQGVVVEDFGIACARADNLLTNIINEVGGPLGDNFIFLSGGENFRKNIYPQYKANRVDQKRPDYLEPLREWLVTEWGAKVTDGIEADDVLGIAQSSSPEGTTIICSLDKDLLQVPGNHYSWEIGTSTWNKPASRRWVSPQEGLFNFYWQIMMGDAADNVPGFDGKMRQKVPKFMEDWYNLLQTYDDEQEMFDFVATHYQLPKEQLLQHAACLWVQRYEGESWLEKGKQLLNGTYGMVESGPKVDTTPLSPQP